MEHPLAITARNGMKPENSLEVRSPAFRRQGECIGDDYETLNALEIRAFLRLKPGLPTTIQAGASLRNINRPGVQG